MYLLGPMQLVFDIFIWLLVDFLHVCTPNKNHLLLWSHESFVNFLSTIRNMSLFCIYA